MKFKLAAALALALSTSISASAATIEASADSFITDHPGLGGTSSNHGSDAALWEIGADGFQAFPLLKFDLSASAGEVVAGPGVLTLRISDTWSGGQVGQMIEANVSAVAWAENTVTWDSYGNDYGSTVDTETLDPAIVGDTATFTIPNAIIQGWIDNPSGNYGLILVSTTRSQHQDILFNTRDAEVGRPTLRFDTASAAPEPAAWAMMLAGFLGAGAALRRRRSAFSA